MSSALKISRPSWARRRERQTGTDWNSLHLVPASSTHGGVEEGRKERSVSERRMKEKRTISGLLVPVAAEIPSELSPPTVLRHSATTARSETQRDR
jgi:hypothetical protein